MRPRNILPLLIFFCFFGCNEHSEKETKETFEIDGDTIVTKVVESDDPNDADLKLSDLTPELRKHITNELEQARKFILKYNGQLPSSVYDANVLDVVFKKWQKNQDNAKESPEYVVQALGAALGQDIVNTLSCEWKVSNQYGRDLTVIHKKFTINCFPFSTAERAVTEKKVGSFQTLKLLMKKSIQDAKKSGLAQTR
jgi:hypothetical protein